MSRLTGAAVAALCVLVLSACGPVTGIATPVPGAGAAVATTTSVGATPPNTAPNRPGQNDSGAGGSGGGASGSEGAGGPVRTSGSISGEGSVTPPAPTVVQVGTVLWWDGFEIHLATATFTPEPVAARVGGTLVVAGTVKNLGKAQRSFANRSEDVSLTASGHAGANVRTFDTAVPGGGTLDFTVGYSLDNAFDPAQTSITFGDSTVTTSTAQLSPGGPVKTVEPRAIRGGITAKTSAVQLEITGGMTDASYRSGEQGQHKLHLSLNATYTGKAVGGYYLAATQFTVSAGNGVIASSPVEEKDLSADALKPNAPATQTSISFLLPAAVGPSVTVTYTGQSDDGVSEKTSFPIPIG